MKLKKSFEAETQNRSQYDKEYVVPVLYSYNGDNDPSFQEQLQRRNFTDYNYCIVMPAASRNLNTILAQENIAARHWDKIKQIFKDIVGCLMHLHSKSVLHGDLKPLNIMRTEDGRYVLIDLDSSIPMGQYAGSKYSSAFLPPEMVHVSSVSNMMEVKSKDSSEYTRILATPSFDLWSLGCILFHLCTAEPLFPSSYDNLDQENLQLLYNWSDVYKTRKLEKIIDMQARNLVSRLLSRKPDHRPSLDSVLAHPFLSGNTKVARLVGEEAYYDIFISYRVDSDFHHAEQLYSSLTEAGLQVWWDKKCLKPGEDWKEGFCAGLINSKHFVCLWSRGAINHASKSWQNFNYLKEDSNADNVYLEYRLCLELKALGLIDKVIPLLIGDTDGAANPIVYSNYFTANCSLKIDTLPDVHVASVEADLKEHMTAQALGSPLKAHRTVRSVMQEMGMFQGLFVEGESTVAWGRVVEGILKECREQKEGSSEQVLWQGGEIGGSNNVDIRSLLSLLKEKEVSLRENEISLRENESLLKEKESLLKEKDMVIEEQKVMLQALQND